MRLILELAIYSLAILALLFLLRVALTYTPAHAYERCAWKPTGNGIVLVCCDTETGKCRISR